MNKTTWFDGRVSKQSLPAFNAPTDATAPVQKRLLLPQGELAQFYDDDLPIQYMAYIELRQGTQRGNHYHKHKREFIYTLGGEFRLLLEDIESKQRASAVVGPGDLVFVSPGIAHTLDVTKPGQAIEFAPARFDAGDIYRYSVTPPT